MFFNKIHGFQVEIIDFQHFTQNTTPKLFFAIFTKNKHFKPLLYDFYV